MPEEDEKKETPEEDVKKETTEEQEEEKKKLPVKTTVEEIAPCRKKVVVEVAAEEVTGRYDEAMEEFSAECIYPGFRKGRAPLALLERKFGKDLTLDLKGKLLAEAVTRALEESSLSPMSMPEIDPDKVEFEKDKALAFDFELDVKPDFDIPPYKGLKIDMPSDEPTDDEVGRYIESMRRRSADIEVVDDGAADGDILTCDARITSGEEELWEKKEIPVVLEEGKLLGVSLDVSSEFVLGGKSGETREVKLKLAKEFGEDHEGREAVLIVALHEVRRPKLLPLDDEFAKKLGTESIDALKSAVRERIAAEKKRAAREELRNLARQKLLEEAKFDLPERIVKEQAEALKKRVSYRFLRRGVPKDELAEHEQEIEDASLRGAEDMVRSYLVIEKIAGEEGIEVDEAELSQAVVQISRAHGLRPEYLRRVMEQEGTLSALNSDLLEQKVLEFVVESADTGDVKEESGN